MFLMIFQGITIQGPFFISLIFEVYGQHKFISFSVVSVDNTHHYGY